jgi:hypothetical protein
MFVARKRKAQRNAKKLTKYSLFVYMCVNPGSPHGADTGSKCSIISDGISPFC